MALRFNHGERWERGDGDGIVFPRGRTCANGRCSDSDRGFNARRRQVKKALAMLN